MTVEDSVRPRDLHVLFRHSSNSSPMNWDSSGDDTSSPLSLARDAAAVVTVKLLAEAAEGKLLLLYTMSPLLRDAAAVLAMKRSAGKLRYLVWRVSIDVRQADAVQWL